MERFLSRWRLQEGAIRELVEVSGNVATRASLNRLDPNVVVVLVGMELKGAKMDHLLEVMLAPRKFSPFNA